MKKITLLILSIVFLISCKNEEQSSERDKTSNAQESLPEVVSGKLERIENFKSEYVTSRKVDIWLPEGYSESSEYSVLYMSDGQMLYDPKSSRNNQAWDIDDVATNLFENKDINKFIVVGVWSDGETRHFHYFPQKPFENLSQTEKDTVTSQLQGEEKAKEVFKPQSDNYLKFLVNELKPFIDKNYAVSTERENTYIMGSSMGGLIALYAICEYPEIFGGAACLSTHWVGTFELENNPLPNAFLEYMAENLPDPKTHKIYFDSGDQELDALYPEIQKKADSIMVSKGYSEENWMTKYFPGENHSEKSWNKRLHIPLEFLFEK